MVSSGLSCSLSHVCLSSGPLWVPRILQKHQIKPIGKCWWRHFCPHLLLLAPPGASKVPACSCFKDIGGIPGLSLGTVGPSQSRLGSSKPGFSGSGEGAGEAGQELQTLDRSCFSSLGHDRRKETQQSHHSRPADRLSSGQIPEKYSPGPADFPGKHVSHPDADWKCP